MKYGFGLFLALACICFLTACSDSLNIDPSDTSAPEVNSISPTSGQIGTVVKIEGAHLHNVTSIKIDRTIPAIVGSFRFANTWAAAIGK